MDRSSFGPKVYVPSTFRVWPSLAYPLGSTAQGSTPESCDPVHCSGILQSLPCLVEQSMSRPCSSDKR